MTPPAGTRRRSGSESGAVPARRRTPAGTPMSPAPGGSSRSPPGPVSVTSRGPPCPVPPGSSRRRSSASSRSRPTKLVIGAGRLCRVVAPAGPDFGRRGGARRRPPLPRRYRQGPRRGRRQRQGAGEALQRRRPGGPAEPPLQVREAPHARPGALRQRLLRQARRRAVVSQEQPERRRCRRLPHGYHRRVLPSPTCPSPPGKRRPAGPHGHHPGRPEPRLLAPVRPPRHVRLPVPDSLGRDAGVVGLNYRAEPFRPRLARRRGAPTGGGGLHLGGDGGAVRRLDERLDRPPAARADGVQPQRPGDGSGWRCWGRATSWWRRTPTRARIPRPAGWSTWAATASTSTASAPAAPRW